AAGDKAVTVWDTVAARTLQTLRHSFRVVEVKPVMPIPDGVGRGEVSRLVFSPGGERLLACQGRVPASGRFTNRRTFTIWYLKTGRALVEKPGERAEWHGWWDRDLRRVSLLRTTAASGSGTWWRARTS